MTRTRQEPGQHFELEDLSVVDASDLNLMGRIHTAESSVKAMANDKRPHPSTSDVVNHRIDKTYANGVGDPVFIKGPANGKPSPGLDMLKPSSQPQQNIRIVDVFARK